jgi:hypothetical protein
MRTRSVFVACALYLLSTPAFAANCTLTPTYAFGEGVGPVPEILHAGAVLIILNRLVPVYRSCELAVQIDVSGAFFMNVHCKKQAWPSAIPITTQLQTFAATTLLDQSLDRFSANHFSIVWQLDTKTCEVQACVTPLSSTASTSAPQCAKPSRP